MGELRETLVLEIAQAERALLELAKAAEQVAQQLSATLSGAFADLPEVAAKAGEDARAALTGEQVTLPVDADTTGAVEQVGELQDRIEATGGEVPVTVDVEDALGRVADVAEQVAGLTEPQVVPVDVDAAGVADVVAQVAALTEPVEVEITADIPDLSAFAGQLDDLGEPRQVEVDADLPDLAPLIGQVETLDATVETLRDPVTVEVTAELPVGEIDDLAVRVDRLDEPVTVTVDVETAGAGELDRIAQQAGQLDEQVETRVVVTADSDLLVELAARIEELREPVTVTVTAELPVGEVAELGDRLDALPDTVTVTVQVEAQDEPILRMVDLLDRVSEPVTVTVTAEVDSAGLVELAGLLDGLPGVRDVTVTVATETGEFTELAGLLDRLTEPVTVTVAANVETGMLGELTERLATLPDTVTVTVTVTAPVEQVVNLAGLLDEQMDRQVTVPVEVRLDGADAVTDLADQIGDLQAPVTVTVTADVTAGPVDDLAARVDELTEPVTVTVRTDAPVEQVATIAEQLAVLTEPVQVRVTADVPVEQVAEITDRLDALPDTVTVTITPNVEADRLDELAGTLDRLDEPVGVTVTVDAPGTADLDRIVEALDGITAPVTVEVTAEVPAAEVETFRDTLTALSDRTVTVDVDLPERDIDRFTDRLDTLTEPVEVEVTADLPTGEIDRLTAQVERLTEPVEVTVDVDVDTGDLDRLTGTLDELGVPVEVTVDTGDAQQDLTELAGTVEQLGGTVQVEVDTSGAEAALTGLGAAAQGATGPVGGVREGLAGAGDAAERFTDQGGAAGSALAVLAARSGALGGALGEATGAMQGLTAAGTGFAAVAGPIGAAAAAVTALGAGLFAFAQPAVTAEAALTRTSIIAGRFRDEIQSIQVGTLNTDLRELAQTLGSNDEAALQAAASVFEFARGSGVAGKEAAEFANQVTALAARAVATGRSVGDLGTATEGLLRGLAAGGRFAQRFGITLSATEIRQRAAANAAKGLGDGVSFTSRVMAGAQLAAEKYGDSLGEVIAKGSGTAEVSLAALRATLSDLTEELGRPLVTPIGEIAVVFRDAVKEAQPLLGVLAKIGFAPLVLQARVFADAVRTVSALVDTLGDAVGSAGRAVGGFIDRLSPEPLDRFARTIGGFIGDVLGFGDAADDAADDAFRLLDALDQTAGRAGGAATALRQVLTETSKPIRLLLDDRELTEALGRVGVTTDRIVRLLGRGQQGADEFARLVRDAFTAAGLSGRELSARVEETVRAFRRGQPAVRALVRETQQQLIATAELTKAQARQIINQSRLADGTVDWERALARTNTQVARNRELLSRSAEVGERVAKLQGVLASQLGKQPAAWLRLAQALARGKIALEDLDRTARRYGLTGGELLVIQDQVVDKVREFGREAAARAPQVDELVGSIAKLGPSLRDAVRDTGGLTVDAIFADLFAQRVAVAQFLRDVAEIARQGFPVLAAALEDLGVESGATLAAAIRKGGPDVARAFEDLLAAPIDSGVLVARLEGLAGEIAAFQLRLQALLERGLGDVARLALRLGPTVGNQLARGILEGDEAAAKAVEDLLSATGTVAADKFAVFAQQLAVQLGVPLEAVTEALKGSLGAQLGDLGLGDAFAQAAAAIPGGFATVDAAVAREAAKTAGLTAGVFRELPVALGRALVEAGQAIEVAGPTLAGVAGRAGETMSVRFTEQFDPAGRLGQQVLDALGKLPARTDPEARKKGEQVGKALSAGVTAALKVGEEAEGLARGLGDRIAAAATTGFAAGFIDRFVFAVAAATGSVDAETLGVELGGRIAGGMSAGIAGALPPLVHLQVSAATGSPAVTGIAEASGRTVGVAFTAGTIGGLQQTGPVVLAAASVLFTQTAPLAFLAGGGAATRFVAAISQTLLSDETVTRLQAALNATLARVQPRAIEVPVRFVPTGTPTGGAARGAGTVGQVQIVQHVTAQTADPLLVAQQTARAVRGAIGRL